MFLENTMLTKKPLSQTLHYNELLVIKNILFYNYVIKFSRINKIISNSMNCIVDCKHRTIDYR